MDYVNGFRTIAATTSRSTPSSVDDEDERKGHDREPDHGGDGVRGAPVGGRLGVMWSVHGPQ